MDSVRAMLDELMGKERDVPLAERSGRNIKYNDPIVCKYQLAGLCPNRLFKNTKSDLGPCIYEIHEDHIEWERLQGEYDKVDEKSAERVGYEKDLLRYLEQLVREMDRKIVKAKDRAEKESAPRELNSIDKSRLDEIQQRMKDALEKSQGLGEEGDVDGSMALAAQADSFKQQHEALTRQLTAPERTMTVCDVCGVFINSTDNEQRRLDHLTGKQYLGWKAIRDKNKELQDKIEARRKEREEQDRQRLQQRSTAVEKDRRRSPRRERERSPVRSGDHRLRSPPRVKDHRDHRDHRDRRDRSSHHDRDHRRGSEIPPPDYRKDRTREGRERDRHAEEPRRRH